LIGAFAVAANTIVPRAYYAMQDTLFPAIYGTVAVLISVPFYLMGLKLMGTQGVALAVSLSSILQVVVLYAFWNKRSHNPGSKAVYRLYLKIIVLSALIGIVLVWFRSVVLARIDATTIAGSLMAMLFTGLLFLIVLLVAGYGFRIDEIGELVRKVVYKLKLAKS
jgi:putative peptidoglycan lipid II flippase